MRIVQILFLVFLCPTLFAQSFTASIDKNPVALGEPFVVTYQLEGADGQRFVAPSLEDGLTLIGGPNSSKKIMSINGRMNVATTYTLVLTAEKNGKLRIGSASVLVNGKPFTAEPLIVDVRGMARTPNTPSSPPAYNPPPASVPQAADESAKLKENVILRAELSKTKVYQGEPVLVSYKLYKRVRMAPGTRMSMPAFDGFWLEELRDTEPGKVVSLNGKQYECFEMRKLLLYPQRAGRLVIPQLDVHTEVYLQDNPVMPQFPSIDDLISGRWQGGGYQSQPYVAKSEPVNLEVMPLPADPAGNFSGLVGEAGLQTELSNKRVETDEAVHLRLTFSGSGNLKMMAAPKLNLPEGWEAYEPEKEEKITVNAQGQSGSITFDYTLVASKAGSYKLHPLRLSYFDLDKGSYVELDAGEFEMEVRQGANPTADSTAQAQAKDSQNSVWESLSKTHFWQYSLGIVALLFVVGFVLLNHKELATYLAGFKPQRQKKQLTESHNKPINPPSPQKLPSPAQADFFSQLNRYLSEKRKQAFSTQLELSDAEWKKICWEHELPYTVCEEYLHLIELCRQNAYAPIKSDADRQALLERVRKWEQSVATNKTKAVLTENPEDEWYFSKE